MAACENIAIFIPFVAYKKVKSGFAAAATLSPFSKARKKKLKFHPPPENLKI
jgi:hypothetical protein